MDKGIYWFYGIVLIILFVFVFVSINSKPMVIEASQQNLHIISTSADAKTMVMPDKLEVYFYLKDYGKDAKTAQQKNKDRWESLEKILKDKKITYETIGFNISPYREYDVNTRKYVLKGYNVSNNLKITDYNINKAGAIIDLLSKQNISGLSISFDLSDEKQELVKKTLYAKAMKSAQSKAEVVAETIGAKLNKLPKNINLNKFNYSPIYRTEVNKVYGVDSDEESLNITPKKIDVLVSLEAVFEYK